jgi:phage tail-like protein
MSISTGTPSMRTLAPEVYNANKFAIELESVLDTFFTELSGMSMTTEVMEFKEGGLNSRTHKLPTRSSYGNITLKRGMSYSWRFWSWYQDTMNGKVDPQNISIMLFSELAPMVPCRRWEIFDAYPIKWTGPSLVAKGGDYAFESIELVCHSFIQVL